MTTAPTPPTTWRPGRRSGPGPGRRRPSGQPADPDRPASPSMADGHALQAALFDAGFAGIAFPRRTAAPASPSHHQKVFVEEVSGHGQCPSHVHGVASACWAPRCSTTARRSCKQRHLPRILRGDEVWIQLLSEPSGGSDMAGAITRATRDGDTWVLNGAKMWSTRRRRGRLRHVPGPHRLGRAQAPRPVDVRRAAAGTPGSRSTDRAGQRAAGRLLPGVLRRRRRARREPHRRGEQRVGGGPDACCSTSATPPPASATALGLDAAASGSGASAAGARRRASSSRRPAPAGRSTTAPSAS